MPKQFKQGSQFSVQFSLSTERVDQFAELSSDHSSLHTIEKFSRRSMYRQRVVHGMLPVMFIAAIPEFINSDKYFVLTGISGSFLKPVFVDDELELTVTVVKENLAEQKLELEYVIRNIKAKSDVTIGQLHVNLQEKKSGEERKEEIKKNVSLVLDKLTETDIPFAQITRNEEKSFLFSVTHDILRTYFSILQEGIGLSWAVSYNEWYSSFNITSILANALLSTFVGMCIPGKHATFLNFSTKFDTSIELQKQYHLVGKVNFKSDSTSILKESISISEKGGTHEIVSANITVKVNMPPVQMPTIMNLKKETMDFQLKDKVVLVTGGSRGIGETIAKLFSLYGAKVAVNYCLSEDDANRVVKEIRENEGQALAIKADVSDRQEVKNMVAKIMKDFGPIDILVNNAVKDAKPINFLELTWEDIQKDIDVTLKGVFNCCQEIVPLMRQKKNGKIINLSTIYTENPPPGQMKYVLTKSAVIGLTRSLAVELAADNIQVNMVVPSIVETDLSKGVPKVFMEQMKNAAPMKRIAQPQDVAKAVIFLASSLSNYTTGQKIMVTGGSAPFL